MPSLGLQMQIQVFGGALRGTFARASMTELTLARVGLGLSLGFLFPASVVVLVIFGSW